MPHRGYYMAELRIRLKQDAYASCQKKEIKIKRNPMCGSYLGGLPDVAEKIGGALLIKTLDGTYSKVSRR